MPKKRYTPLQLFIYIAGWIPLVWLLWAYLSGNLTVNPIQAATQRSGQFAIFFLLLSLTATPINTLFGFHQALKVRRALGLFAFMYASIHFLIFSLLDYQLDWELIVDAILEKRFILVGASALVILIALAITSFRWWMKRLGKGWRTLHRLVYIASILVVLHFAWARKGNLFNLSGDIQTPLLTGTVLLFLLLLRLPVIRKNASYLSQRIRSRNSRRTRSIPGR